MSPDHSAAADACERIRRHLDQGAPWEGCDVFRDEIANHPGNAELLYWGALAHARAGAAQQAHALLDLAQGSRAPQRLADILSLRGRLWKDAYRRVPGGVVAKTMAERARKEYLAAYALQRDPYPGVNAATLSLLLGDVAGARKLAREVIARLAALTTPRTAWDHATAGEAHLLLGEVARARECYADAYREAGGNAGNVATMRRQVNLLSRGMPQATEMLEVLIANDVIAFAGHMIDAPDRPAPRFPSAMAPIVEDAVRKHLAQLKQPVVYTSAACGADLILIEAAVAIGAEVNVVLPFDRNDFVRTSVAVGGDRWVDRFDAALSRATSVTMATEESHLGDDVLFEHAAQLVEGFAVLRAEQLETKASMLCVIDAGSTKRVGGTLASVERWKQRVGAPEVIDLSALRARLPLANQRSTRKQADAATKRAAGAEPSQPALPAARPERTLKTMLFADFAGYSRVQDALAPLFQASFLKVAAAQIEAAPVKPLIASTWGDALYVVFDSPRDAAEFALSFLASTFEVDWTAVGLPDSSPIRIALHTGPVFCGFDPIMGRDTYYGSSVNKAARIEPITRPGMVYTSEAFAATLAASGQHDYVLEYIGRLKLAKDFGESRIYRLDRR
ncbi:MAG TPA: adenylate/guanylate cyclase domain-containing protein [Casimicrobiaceae bacterium]|nr:adenylate/guanylate cyclase domain-containing protein [Casimicrobiaceae bacterium]